MTKNEAIRSIQSVFHALQLLEIFNIYSDKQEFGVTELSKRLDLHKNNVFRILATLEARGYIEQNPMTETYRLGIKVFTLGQQFINKFSILKLAKPFMHKIAEEVKEAIYLGILRDSHVIYIDMVEPKLTIKVMSRVGRDVPAYCTAIGKIQLAYASEEEINKIFITTRLKQYTKNTIKTVDELKKHLSEIAKLDYAIDNEEFEDGIKCVAVPIKDYLGVPIAAFSLTAPAYRLNNKRINNQILPVLKKYVKEISKRLGYNE